MKKYLDDKKSAREMLKGMAIWGGALGAFIGLMFLTDGLVSFALPLLLILWMVASAIWGE